MYNTTRGYTFQRSMRVIKNKNEREESRRQGKKRGGASSERKRKATIVCNK